MNTQIQLGSNGYLDVSEDIILPLTYSIAEIQDISKRQGSFSKTITLPGTSNNNFLFGNLFDANTKQATFRFNKRTPCTILQNSIPILNGYLQLVNIIKQTPSQENQDQEIFYEVLVVDGTSNLFLDLSDKLLTDLSGWEKYTHLYNIPNILATSAHTVDNGYTYILTETTDTRYRLQDFQPAIYAKTYFDRIFIDAGYSYEWDSLYENEFDKLIIPYNGDVPISTTNQNSKFRASMTGDTTYIFSAITTGETASQISLLFQDETTNPNTDQNNLFDGFNYVSNIQSAIEFVQQYEYKVELSAPVHCFWFPNSVINDSVITNEASKLSIKLKNNIGNQTDNTTIPINNAEYYNNILLETTNGEVGGVFYEIQAGTTLIQDTIFTPTFFGLTNVNSGQTINSWVEAEFKYENGFWLEFGTNLPLPDADIPRLRITLGTDANSVNNYFATNISNNLSLNEQVLLQNFIPRNIEQKQFLKSIFTMFNLYAVTDKDISNKLILKTRDDFYDEGTTLDWSNKLTVDNDSSLTFLPDLQNKKFLFTYKSDSDLYNKEYTNNTGDIYGQLTYEFDNDFVKDTKTITTIFSPTPSVLNNDILVPTINSKAPKNNIRILYYDGWRTAPNGATWRLYDLFTTLTTTYSSYPMASHFDNPYLPKLDFNFGQTQYLYDQNLVLSVTDNNLYNRYYKRFISQINSGKLLKARFNLDEMDISNLDFSKKIWIYDTYWLINKIVDYSAGIKQLTEVELISLEDGVRFEPFNGPVIGSELPANAQRGGILNEISIENQRINNTIGSNVTNTIVLGEGNIVQASSTNNIIVGNDNDIQGTSNMIYGSGNIVSGSDVLAFGINNQRIDSSGITLFNNPVVINNNFISAGVDEVLNPFSSSVINLISGSFDEVRQLGSESVVSKISGGIDVVI